MVQAIEDIETELLINAIFHKYGYDFRQYHAPTLKRRFEQFARNEHLPNISSLIPKILHNPAFFSELFVNMSVTVTEMFRDPELYQILREKAVPKLKTYPYLNVWNAGCATGEEAYSMAIMLKEEGLLNRTQIYATDINDHSLAKANRGIFPIKQMKRYTENYNQAGGATSLSDYFYAKYNSVKLRGAVLDKITFSKHNLAMDGVFAEMHLIICKNVLIYFKKSLQHKVIELLADSLCYNGYLCLGDKESLDFTSVRNQFIELEAGSKIYQKKFPSISGSQ